jgi:hypothetical protein
MAHGHVAGIEAHDEGGQGSRWHERPCPVGVVDGLGECLGHIGARVELKLDERDTLDRFRLDVLNARDVEEVVLVVIGEVAFHLCGVHPSIGLGHVNRGYA